MNRTRSITLALTLAAALLTGCNERETKTVVQVKTDYAKRFVEGLDFGLAGRIQAETFDPNTLILKDVRIDDGPDRLYHAEFAEMHVSTEANTIVLEFISITGADAINGGIGETPVATTPPVKLPFNIIE